MRLNRIWIHALSACVALLFGSSFAQAQPSYRLTALGSLGGGNTYPMSINDSGQVTGYSSLLFTLPPAEEGGEEQVVRTTRAFLWETGLMQDIGNLFDGHPYVDSYAQAINENGQVVGFTRSESGPYHAFLWSGGIMQDLGTLEGLHDSRARAINNAAHVVGISGGYRAFAWDGTSMRDLGTLSGQLSIAHGINDDGMIVGAAEVAPGPWWHAAIFDGASNVDLGTLGGLDSWAVAVNASGQIAGSSTYMVGDRDSGTYHPFLWDDSSMRDLGTLGGTHAEAWGMNDDGHVVGHSELGSGFGGIHAFLWDGSAMRDLNTLIDANERPYVVLEVATDINNSGQIVAFGYDSRNPARRPHAFLLSPNEGHVLLSGFYGPLDPIPTLNEANAGRTIPLAFHVENPDGTAVDDLTSVEVTFAASNCSAMAFTGTDPIEQYATGAQELVNKGNGDYQINWKTVKGLGGCGVVTLALPTGYTSAPDKLQANLRFK